MFSGAIEQNIRLVVDPAVKASHLFSGRNFQFFFALWFVKHNATRGLSFLSTIHIYFELAFVHKSGTVHNTSYLSTQVVLFLAKEVGVGENLTVKVSSESNLHLARSSNIGRGKLR